MCNSKPKVQYTPPAAPSVAPPETIKTDNLETTKETPKKSKGKRKLTIPSTNSAKTGVNL